MTTSTDILVLFGKCGMRYTPKILSRFLSYVGLMLRDERVVEIRKDGELIGVLLFALDSDLDKFYKKKTWDYVPHNLEGDTVYIELCASLEWNKKLRVQFEEAIVSRFPQIKFGRWHEWKKRGDHEVKVPVKVTLKEKLYV